MTCPYSRHDGAYLLGAMSAQERRSYEEHLPGCPTCGSGLNEVAGLPGLLAQLPTELVDGVGPPPAVLLPTLLRAVEAERRRRRWRIRVGAVAAAAAVVAAALLGPAVLQSDGSHTAASATPRQVAMDRVTDLPVRATAALSDRPWGTQVDLRCTYSGEVDGNRGWVLVALDRAGKAEQIASWAVLPYGEAKVTGSTSLHAADLAAIEVRTTTGVTLLRMRR
ncbi:MAG: zf-HC2 domain-containing protein [Mycobacteriales bacterium]